MATPLHVELVTPERVLYSGESEEVSLRSDGGEISFLAHHEDFVGAIDITDVAIHLAESGESSGNAIHAAVHGGFVEVNEDGVVILAGVAELSNEIDVPRAERALARAEERLTFSESAAETRDAADGETPPELMSGAMLALLAPESADAAVRRARTRLEVAGTRSGT